MKFNKILAALAVSAGFLAVSCEDQPDAFVATDGVPTVHFVRYADQDVVITQAFMEEPVCIVGDNLRSVNELWFNDQRASLNTSFITDNTILTNVPKKTALVKTDKIYLITAAKDTVTYDFKVLAPAPVVKEMSNEYAKPGQKVTVKGQYFISPLSIDFTGVVLEEADLESMTETELVFNVPEGAVQGGTVKVTTASGTVAAPFQYMDPRGVMFDFDDDGDKALATNKDNCWHARVIKTDDTAIDGNYVQLGNDTGLNENADWNDGQYAFEYWCGDWNTPQNIASGPGIALYNIVDFTDFASMSLKFEMCIPADTPWKSGAMQIAFQSISQLTVSGNPVDGYETVGKANAYAFNNDEGDLGNWSRAMYRPWEVTGEYHTSGEWETVTVPFSSFIYNKDGGAATMPLSNAQDFASLTMFVLGGGVTGAECAPIIKIDNIRAVPNK